MKIATPGHSPMSMRDRAEQFAPYKSLVGFEEMIGDETKTVLSSDKVVIDYSEADEVCEEWIYYDNF